MLHSYEGHRDKYKLLTLERTPSKVGRRQKVLYLGGTAERASGSFRGHIVSRPDGSISGCQCMCGEGLSRLEKTELLLVQKTVECLFGVKECNVVRD